MVDQAGAVEEAATAAINATDANRLTLDTKNPANLGWVFCDLNHLVAFECSEQDHVDQFSMVDAGCSGFNN